MTVEQSLVKQVTKLAPRLRDISDGYRVASDAFTAATIANASDAVLSALWALLVREARAADPGTHQ